MNRVFILGRLGARPELSAAKSGDPYCRLRVATSRAKDQADWHSVFVFGKTAETCAKHLRKGAVVLIEGRLNYWQSAEGERPSYGQSIKADDVQFITLGTADGAPVVGGVGDTGAGGNGGPGGQSVNLEHLDNPDTPRNHETVAHPA